MVEINSMKSWNKMLENNPESRTKTKPKKKKKDNVRRKK